MKANSLLLAEAISTRWAMTEDSLRAMLAVFDVEGIRAEDYRLFHSLSEDARAEMADSFGRNIQGSNYSSVDGNVGYLTVFGPIIPRATAFSNASGQVSLSSLTHEFNAMEENPDIDTIVHLMDSPGGNVTGVSDYAELVRMSQKRTVSFSWKATSAANWIAAASDEMHAPPTGVFGSIGTIITIKDSSKADLKKGVRNVDMISTQSPLKNADPETPEGAAAIRTVADDMSDVFIGAMAEYRETTREDVIENYGRGAIVVATRAIKAGMLDEIQDIHSFSKSLVKEERIYSFNNSARAEQTEGMTMTVKKNTPLTAAEMRENNPAAVEEIEAAARAAGIEEGRASGIESESSRIQNIEALKLKFANALPAVKAAANAAIDDGKWKSGATAENMAPALLEVVASAQTGAVEDFANGPRAAADIAAHASPTAPEIKTADDKNAPDSDRVSGMLAAAKAEGRIR